MADEQAKQLRAAIKAELSPLVIGVRNEIKALNAVVEKLVAKEPPAVQAVEVKNQPAAPTEISVNNLPEIQKTQIVNPQTEVEVKGIVGLFTKTVGSITDYIGATTKDITGAIKRGFDDLAKRTLTVHVDNQPAPPAVLDVRVLNQKDAPFPTEFTIANKSPRDAIPVKLVTPDGKSFYAAIAQIMAAGGDVNMHPTNVLLTSILAAIAVAVDNETPAGTKNGVNLNFTTAYSYRTGTTKLFVNGVRQREGVGFDYIENGTNQIQFAVAPAANDTLLVDYVKL